MAGLTRKYTSVNEIGHQRNEIGPLISKEPPLAGRRKTSSDTVAVLVSNKNRTRRNKGRIIMHSSQAGLSASTNDISYAQTGSGTEPTPDVDTEHKKNSSSMKVLKSALSRTDIMNKSSLDQDGWTKASVTIMDQSEEGNRRFSLKEKSSIKSDRQTRAPALRRSNSVQQSPTRSNTDNNTTSILRRMMSMDMSTPSLDTDSNNEQKDKDQDQAKTIRTSKDGQMEEEEKKRTRKDSGGSVVGAEVLKKKTPSLDAAKARPSLMSISKRVNNILRVRKALGGKSKADSIEEEDVISANEVVLNLPKTPRFSSFMSAEAQYAMMKGYEDLLTERLEKDDHMDAVTLKRNKTPCHQIHISDKPNLQPIEKKKHSRSNKGGFWSLVSGGGNKAGNHSNENDGKDTQNEQVQTNREASGDSSELGNVDRQSSAEKHVNGTTSSTDRSGPSPSLVSPRLRKEQTDLTPLQNLRRMSLSFPINKPGSNLADESASPTTKAPPSLQSRRSYSGSDASHHILPYSRRLVLSYRLESAMDILDKIKPESEHALSPRVKAKAEVTSRPAFEYNRWSTQWANEFATGRQAVD